MAEEDIVQRIALEGAPEVVAGFMAMEGAANKMCDAIKRVYDQGNLAFPSLIKLTSAAAASFGVLAGAMATLSVHGAEAIAGMEHLANTMGTNVESVSALSQAFARMGVDLDGLGNAFKRLAVSSARATDEMVKSEQENFDKMISNRLKLEHLNNQIAKDELERRKEQGFAIPAGAEEDLKQRDKQIERINHQIERLKLLHEEGERQRNDVAALGREIDKLVSGGTPALEKFNLTAKNLATAILANHTPMENITRLSAVFSSGLLDNSEKLQLLTQTMGRVQGPAMQRLIDALSQGPQSITRAMDIAKEAGLSFSESQADAAKRIELTWKGLTATVSSLGDQLAVAMDFSGVFASIDQFLTENRAIFISWAQALANAVIPVLQDLFRWLRGEEVEMPWVKQLLDGLALIGTVIGTVTSIILQGIGFWLEAFGQLGEGINAVFGEGTAGQVVKWAAIVVAGISAVVYALELLGVTLATGGAAVGAAAAGAAEVGIFATIMNGVRMVLPAIAAFAAGYQIVSMIMDALDYKRIKTQQELRDEAIRSLQQRMAAEGASAEQIAKVTATIVEAYKTQADASKSSIDSQIKKFDDLQKKIADLQNQAAQLAQVKKLDVAEKALGTTADYRGQVEAVKDLGQAQKSQHSAEQEAIREDMRLANVYYSTLAAQRQSAMNDEKRALAEKLAAGQITKAEYQKELEALKEIEETEKAEAELRKAFTEAQIQGTTDANNLYEFMQERQRAFTEDFYAGQLLIQSGWGDITSAAGQSAQGVEQAGDKMVSSLQEVDRAIDTTASNMASLEGSGAGGGGGEIAAGASGGLFHGRWGGIDTNLAWLTSGEFIMNTRAVAKYGLGVMHALNSLTFPAFNSGGLFFGTRLPSFAQGDRNIGSIGARSHDRSFTLVLDGQRFSRLSGPADSVSRLEQYAIATSTRATGRKPGWIR